MADMFGAPLGVRAAEEDMRQNVAGALSAQKTLGEIAAQPAQQQMTEAHARLYTAEAGQKEAAGADQARLGQLMLKYRAQSGLAAVGQGASKPTAQGFLDFAEAEGGISPTTLFALQEKTAARAKHEAQTATAQVEQQLKQLDVENKTNEQMGSLATSMMRSDQGYHQGKLLLLNNPNLPPQLREKIMGLPQAREEGLVQLQQFLDRSMTRKDALAAKREELRVGIYDTRSKAQNAASSAAAKLSGIKTKQAQLDYDDAQKNGGKYSKQAQDRKDRAATARDLEGAAKRSLDFPPAPPDLKLLKENKSYTAADGSLFKWMQDSDGNLGPRWMTGPRGTALGREAAVVAADEIDDEGDE